MNRTSNLNSQKEILDSDNIYQLHLKLSTIAQIKNIANQHKLSQDTLVWDAIHFYAHHLSIQPINIKTEESKK